MSMLMLFFVFFYVGLFAIGGGLVAASFMRQALVEQYGLITDEKFYSMLAISESTPGPIGINIATYIGTELHGIPGGIIATFGEVLPSIIIIILIARFFSKFQEKPLVKSIFSAMRPCTSGMVMSVFDKFHGHIIVLVSRVNDIYYPRSLLDMMLFGLSKDVHNQHIAQQYILNKIIAVKLLHVGRCQIP